jgi:stage II sporulation protein M
MTSTEQRAYLRELRPYLIASIIFFAVGIAFGLAVVLRFPQFADLFRASLTGFLRMFRGLPKPELAFAIFLNNTIKTLIAILLGTALGIVPALFLVANGVVLGFVLFLSAEGRGIWLSLMSILPHGIFELPAVFLGTSIGFMLGDRALKRLLGHIETRIGAELRRALSFFAAAIVPLLLLAALVEAFVTTLLVAGL